MFGRRTAILVALALTAFFVALVVRAAWVTDDAYITFRTVDNFVHGYGLRWNVDERVQVFTHPLWMLLFSGFYYVTREAYSTSIVLSVLLAAATALVLALRARTPWAGWIGVGLLCSSKGFIEYSTSGLEDALSHLLLVVFFTLLLRPREAEPPGILGSAFLAGLVVLNRIDLVLLVAPALAWLVVERRSWSTVLRAAAGFLPLLLWTIFSVVYYGFPVPNTAVAKLQPGLERAELIEQGLHYLENSLRGDPATLVTIAGGVALAVVWRSRRAWSAAAGVVLYLAYVVWVGGDFMAGRFLTEAFVVAVACIVSSPLLERSRRLALGCAALLAASLLAPGSPAATLVRSRAGTPEIDPWGIADERAFYRTQTGLWDREGGVVNGPGVRAGGILREENDPFWIAGAIGLVGYYAGPDVHIVDYHGLADPLLARLPMVEHDPLYEVFVRYHTGAAPRRGWRPGHYLRVVPRGYVAYLLGDPQRFDDPAVERLAHQLDRVTRGPLFDGRRWADIVRLNLGLEEDRIDGARYRTYRDPPWDEVIAGRPRFIEGYLHWANMLRERGDLDQAFDVLEAALEQDPDNAIAANNIGWILEQRGEAEKAQEYYRRAGAAATPR